MRGKQEWTGEGKDEERLLRDKIKMQFYDGSKKRQKEKAQKRDGGDRPATATNKKQKSETKYHGP